MPITTQTNKAKENHDKTVITTTRPTFAVARRDTNSTRQQPTTDFERPQIASATATIPATTPLIQNSIKLPSSAEFQLNNCRAPSVRKGIFNCYYF